MHTAADKPSSERERESESEECCAQSGGGVHLTLIIFLSELVQSGGGGERCG